MTQLTDLAITEFDRTTSPQPVDARPGVFHVDLDAGWSSLVGVHGGYQVAVAVRAAEQLATDRVVRTTSTSFLRSGRVGPAELAVREVRRGRTITAMVAELVQDDQLLNVTRMTLMTERSGVEWGVRRPLHLPPAAVCERFIPPPQVVNFERIEQRFDPDHMPFTDDRPRVAGWVRPLESRPIDAAWLAMVVDGFPPPAFARADIPIGGMSIDMTVHVHRSGFALGDDDWLTGEFSIEDSAGGLGVEHGRIALADGTIVAESFQTRLTAGG